MRHHFINFLSGEDDYWKMSPNSQRYSMFAGKFEPGDPDVVAVTLGKEEKEWKRVLSFPNLEELTLHRPTQPQIKMLSKLTHLKRLRISHKRPKTIEFLEDMVNVEELVLEYVSGFADLSPVGKLPKLRSLQLENLRSVSDFEGLSECENLRFLMIDGTVDWDQPISSFEFVRGLPNLEVLALGFFRSLSEYPALFPLLSLNKLKRLKLPPNKFDVRDYALLTVGMKGVEGAEFEAYRTVSGGAMPMPEDDPRMALSDEEIIDKHSEEVRITYLGTRLIEDPDEFWFEFTGRNAGRIKRKTKGSAARCAESKEAFDKMKSEARELIERGAFDPPAKNVDRVSDFISWLKARFQ